MLALLNLTLAGSDCCKEHELHHNGRSCLCRIPSELHQYAVMSNVYVSKVVAKRAGRVESRYLYAAPNSLFSHNGAGRWFTLAGKAESSAGA